MEAKPWVSCARPLNLPVVTSIGPFSIAAIAAPPGNSSLTVLLINKSSGRNADQAIASSKVAPPKTILRFLIKDPPQPGEIATQTLGSGWGLDDWQLCNDATGEQNIYWMSLTVGPLGVRRPARGFPSILTRHLYRRLI